MSVLVIAEHDNASIKGATLNTVTAALACGGEVHGLVAGHNAGAAAAAAAQIAGVAKVLPADSDALGNGLAENIAAQVIAVSCGPAACQETLRTAMAIGADRAVLLETSEALEPLAVAKLMRHVAQKEGVTLAIFGKQAIDDDAGQTGQMFAALMGWPQATFASKVEAADGGLAVTREIDGGLETLQLALPAVVTADLRLNEPRFITLPSIMKAKKKPMEVLEAAALGIDIAPRLKTLKVMEPAARKAGVQVADVNGLVKKLKEEAKVIA